MTSLSHYLSSTIYTKLDAITLSLYPGLNRLEKKGLISWRWGNEEEVSGGARRKYYKITALGISTLKQVQQYRISLAERASQRLFTTFRRLWTYV